MSIPLHHNAKCPICEEGFLTERYFINEMTKDGFELAVKCWYNECPVCGDHTDAALAKLNVQETMWALAEARWNSEADEFNQWCSLDSQEKSVLVDAENIKRIRWR